MHSFAPDGWILDHGEDQGAILYGGPRPGGHLVAGWEVTTIDLRHVSEEARAQAHARLVSLLAGLHLGMLQIQFAWKLSPSFAGPLGYYKRETERLSHVGPEKAVALRREIAADFEERMLRGELRRERLQIFVTAPVEAPPLTRVPLDAKLRASVEVAFASLSAAGDAIRLLLGDIAAVKPLTGCDLFAAAHEALNPDILWRSLAWENESEVWRGLYRPELPLQTLVHQATFKAGGPGPHSFTGGGLFHGAYVMTQMPAPPAPDEHPIPLTLPLLSLPISGYAVTATIRPMETREQIEELQKRLTLARGSRRHSGRPEDEVEEEKLAASIRDLAGGYMLPQKVRFAIHTWADSIDELQRQGIAIKNAANLTMRGAQLYESSLFRESLRVVWERVPGWCGAWRSYLHETTHHRVADLLPISGSFTGSDRPQVLLDGGQGGVVGLRVDVGGSPLNGYIAGKKGSGKGLLANSLLLQTAPYLSAAVIIEDGPSYAQVVREVFEEEPIVVRADTGLRINPFDSVGSPMDGEKMGMIVALLTLFTGADSKETKQRRSALLGHYLIDFLANAATGTVGERYAVAVERLRREMLPGAGIMDAWAAWRGLRKEQREMRLDAVTQSEITELATTVRGRGVIAAISAAFLRPDQVPTLTDYISELRAARHPDHDKSEVRFVSDLLSAWSATAGQYKLFDGETNVRLNGRATYFQLDQIPRTDQTLREAAFLLIAGHVRQHLMSLPASGLKLVIFDEAASILESSAGVDLIAQYYRQGRKSGIGAYSVFQDFAGMRSQALRSAILGGSDQGFVFKLGNVVDRTSLATEAQIPTVAMEAVARSADPGEMVESNRFSTLLVHLVTGAQPATGIARHRVVPTLLRLADTSPTAREARQAAEQEKVLEALELV